MHTVAGVRPAIPWPRVAAWSAVGALASLLLVVNVVHRTGDNVLNLIQPGAQGPAHAVFAADFPRFALPQGSGHDGQQFYAIARAPMHPQAVAPSLGGNPRYRLQRIFFPIVAWALHPAGGGIGLVRAMIAVSVLALFGGGMAAGALSVSLGGPSWAAVAFGSMPGTYAALRITTPDHLAMALLVAAFALSVRERPWWAVAAAVAAVLTREVSLVPLAGLAVWRRDRFGVFLVAVPAVVAGGWFVWLRTLFPGVPYGNDRVPFLAGVREAWNYWLTPAGLGSLIIVTMTAALVVAVLVLRRRSPLLWPVVLSFASTLFLGAEAINLFYNLARTVLPTMTLAAVALVVPRRPSLE